MALKVIAKALGTVKGGSVSAKTAPFKLFSRSHCVPTHTLHCSTDSKSVHVIHTFALKHPATYLKHRTTDGPLIPPAHIRIPNPYLLPANSRTLSSAFQDQLFASRHPTFALYARHVTFSFPYKVLA